MRSTAQIELSENIYVNVDGGDPSQRLDNLDEHVNANQETIGTQTCDERTNEDRKLSGLCFPPEN